MIASQRKIRWFEPGCRSIGGTVAMLASDFFEQVVNENFDRTKTTAQRRAVVRAER